MARTPSKPPASVENLGVHERIDARRNRQRILSATARLVREGRIDDLSMDDIASAAGVGIGTVYRRFGDRDGLLRALSEGPCSPFRTPSLPERLRSDRVLLHESASSPSASAHMDSSRRSPASSAQKTVTAPAGTATPSTRSRRPTLANFSLICSAPTRAPST
jgi:hypothetical protein